MTAKEFDKSTKGKYNQATYDFAESYFKARVNKITDEDIHKIAFNQSYLYREDKDFLRQDAVKDGCENALYILKQKLLED